MHHKLNVLICLFCLLVAIQAEAQIQIGRATYYAHKFHGKKTSSGKIYHKDSMTCAHHTLPFGTWLLVRDINTKKEVIVEVTDRLGRSPAIIDLSYAAAKKIGLFEKGHGKVELYKLKGPAKIMCKPTDSLKLPILEVEDPLSDGKCPLSEWAERNKHKKELEKDAPKQSPKSIGEVKYKKEEQESHPNK